MTTTMGEGDVCDFVIGIDYNGQGHIIEACDGFIAWAALRILGNWCEDNFSGLPAATGVYRVTARYREADPLDPCRFAVTQYEAMRLEATGRRHPEG